MFIENSLACRSFLPSNVNIMLYQIFHQLKTTHKITIESDSCGLFYLLISYVVILNINSYMKTISIYYFVQNAFK